jgi:hypothetical protein
VRVGGSAPVNAHLPVATRRAVSSRGVPFPLASSEGVAVTLIGLATCDRLTAELSADIGRLAQDGRGAESLELAAE